MPKAPHPARRHYGARAAGYPGHRVVESREWTNPHGVRFVDWTAACGHTQTSEAGSASKDPLGYLAAEMCKTCWE